MKMSVMVKNLMKERSKAGGKRERGDERALTDRLTLQEMQQEG